MPQVDTTNTLEEPILEKCFHCGDSCENNIVEYDLKAFCCNGCQMVYSILTENNLNQFYNLNPHAGTSQRLRAHTSHYAYLDNDSTIEQLIDFTDGNHSKVHFHLPQIHCSSCLWLLEHLYLLNKGVIRSRIDFLKKQVFIDYQHKEITLKELVILLAKIGYPPNITLQELESTETHSDRSLYYKLGLAGFVFGNIMLLSFPEYLGINQQGNEFLSRILGYLNLVLILPILLYSGKDYFISAWMGLRQKHLNIDVPISLGIFALFSRSCYEIISQTGAGYLDTLAGLIFFLLIGKWFQKLTYKQISFDRDYKSYFPIACNIQGQNGEEQITLDQLEKGHNVYIRHGELIPADAILLEGQAQIDYSFITGESRAANKIIGDKVYAGGRQKGGLIKVSVVKNVSSAYLTQLWNDSSFTKDSSRGTASKIADRVASKFTAVILMVAFASLFYWLKFDIGMAINAFSSVLIIACPCAVALAIPFSFGNALRVLARKGIFVKNISVFEGLNEVDHIVFDKTGTLTIPDSKNMVFQGRNISEIEKIAIKSLAMQSMHPKSKSIATFLGNEDTTTINDFSEEEGLGIEGHANGMPLKIGSAKFLQLETSESDSSRGSTYVSINGANAGAFIQKDVYRKGIKDIMNSLRSKYEVSMLSGDTNREQTKMEALFGSQLNVLFSQTPQQKLEYIRRLQNQGKKVVMIGDGLNDAGALQSCDIGIALTDNTSHFTPACDIILHGRTFPSLANLFSYAKMSVTMIYVAYAIAVLYNVIGLTYAVQGLLSPVIAAILMPLSSISILVFGVGTSSLLAYKKGLL